MNRTPSSFAATSCIVPANPTNATLTPWEEKVLHTLTPALANSKSLAICPYTAPWGLMWCNDISCTLRNPIRAPVWYTKQLKSSSWIMERFPLMWAWGIYRKETALQVRFSFLAARNPAYQVGKDVRPLWHHSFSQRRRFCSWYRSHYSEAQGEFKEPFESVEG